MGVAPDIRSNALRGKVARRFFVPVQHSMGGDVSFVNYVIRTAAEPGSVLSAVRRTIRDTDRSIPITNADSFDELIDRRIQTERVIAQLSAFFGLLALLLASVGLYCVLSYAVARRTNEIGIRIAVGAGQRTVIWMILKETILLVLIGAVAGGAAAVAMARLVASHVRRHPQRSRYPGCGSSSLSRGRDARRRRPRAARRPRGSYDRLARGVAGSLRRNQAFDGLNQLIRCERFAKHTALRGSAPPAPCREPPPYRPGRACRRTEEMAPVHS